MVSGVSVQVSGRNRKQMTEDKEQSVFCHPNSVFCYLTPDTWNLKPKIKPCFVNSLRNTRLVRCYLF
jgi:hypothetical protein